MALKMGIEKAIAAVSRQLIDTAQPVLTRGQIAASASISAGERAPEVEGRAPR